MIGAKVTLGPAMMRQGPATPLAEQVGAIEKPINNYPDPTEMLADMYQSGLAIMEKKNHDYRGGSGDPYANFRGSVLFNIDPIVGIMLRMQDKMMRIETFVEKGELKVENESIKDALIDLTNYTALIWGLINETKA